MLRTSLSLASITGKALEVRNIRAGRTKPGLMPQHLISAIAASKITEGSLKGAEIGSSTLVFRPGTRPVAGRYTFDVAERKASAGSTGLIFQTVAIPLVFATGPSRVAIKGGTHVAWSPTADYIRDVYVPVISSMGVDISIEIPRYGFYPIGGGELFVGINSVNGTLKPINLAERGRIISVTIRSAVSNLPESIAMRQLDSALKALGDISSEVRTECLTVPGAARGTFLFILIETENIRAGFSALGERGKPAEKVGSEAARLALAYIESTGAVDPYLSDQLVLPMALARGVSSFKTTEITGHLLTNLDVIGEFLDVDFRVDGEPGFPGDVTITGAGVTRG